MQQNKVLLIAIGVFVFLLIALQAKLQNGNTDFLGIAESRESQVNFEYPVEIRRIHVIPGQNVAKGDLLVELDQSSLNSQLRNLKTQVAKLEAQQKLVKDVSNLINPNSQAVMISESDPAAVELSELKKELAIVENNKKNLLVFAQVDGVVGAVNFRKGEKIPAFSALLTISPHYPTYVQAFVHENLNIDIQIGQVIKVRSAVKKEHELFGKVVSVGSRIIPVPQRLLRIATIQTFGREVIVALPGENAFLHGEKVEIDASKPWISFMSKALAESEETSGPRKIQPEDILVPPSSYEVSAVEPSGMLFLPDLSKFLVVSDDTNTNHEPMLFLMNEDGHLDEEVLKVSGLTKIGDVESISADADAIYLMSSSSVSSDGERKDFRELFVRLTRDGLNLKLDKSANFGELLRKAMAKSTSNEIQEMLSRIKQQEDPHVAKKGLDIEAHYIQGKDLYLGLKSPSFEKEAVILKIQDFASVFEKELLETQLSVFKRLQLGTAIVGHKMRLSDLLVVGNQLYFSSSCENMHCSAFWRTSNDGNKSVTPEMIWFFDKFQLEGLAFNPATKTVWGVFDEGKSNPKYFKYSIENDPTHL